MGGGLKDYSGQMRGMKIEPINSLLKVALTVEF
jgi:hypothetical protein